MGTVFSDPTGFAKINVTRQFTDNQEINAMD